ncbi:MAG TPA: hypothetical protein VJP40_08590 [bacterium]|nr:hypothetical protein [bacterium]
MLQELQNWIESTYRLEMEEDLSPYLIGKRELKRILKPGDPFRQAEEVVLCTESGGECFLGLYLKLRGSRLHRLLTTLEGVSHLRLMMHRLKFGENLSRLELELQAEIDKFVFLRLQKPDEDPAFHLRRGADLPGLNAEQRRLYGDSRRLANRYCLRLEREFLSTHSRDGLFRELRGFYRMSHWRKLEHLGAP